MCNTVFISTTSEEDLSKLESPSFSFSLWSEDEYPEAAALLGNPNRWFIYGRYGGCSCHFRHIADNNLSDKEFHEPYDWCPEDPEEVEDTGAIYDVFNRLIEEGHKLDIIDLWNDGATEGFETITICLTEVTREKFLFLENHRLILTP